jgi:hypothetical protein
MDADAQLFTIYVQEELRDGLLKANLPAKDIEFCLALTREQLNTTAARDLIADTLKQTDSTREAAKLAVACFCELYTLERTLPAASFTESLATFTKLVRQHGTRKGLDIFKQFRPKPKPPVLTVNVEAEVQKLTENIQEETKCYKKKLGQ